MPRALLLASLMVLTGCASSRDLPVERPDVHVRQLGDVSIVIEMGGTIPVAYLVTVRNRAEIPLAIRTVELHMMGGGPYSVQQRERFFPRTIAPGETTEVRIDALLMSRGGRNASREPITFRVRISFGSDAGSFQVQELVRINP